MWLLGDIYKLGYYSANLAPLPLILCSAFQVATDVAILVQIYYYRNNGYSKIMKYKEQQSPSHQGILMSSIPKARDNEEESTSFSQYEI